MTAFLIDVAGPDHEAAVKTTLAKMQILKSQINNARLMADIAEEEVQKGIRQLRDNLFLSQQSHEAESVGDQVAGARGETVACEDAHGGAEEHRADVHGGAGADDHGAPGTSRGV